MEKIENISSNSIITKIKTKMYFDKLFRPIVNENVNMVTKQNSAVIRKFGPKYSGPDQNHINQVSENGTYSNRVFIK